MGDITNTPGEMDALARSLEAGAAKLDGMRAAPIANAGESIGMLAQAVGQLAETSAGVSGGLHRTVEDIHAARDEYTRTDHDGANNMPQPPR
ncbi:hypothetical protein [Saccharopolyspora dendranthemae]|uniref:Excreted virulence factor EspC (Type VII ESX diderm) n=1 Tax=Saccharopolyspora dendranthemae TaxID=1181886 RepID=A0A561U4J6_9PSEU|nr:hypothetical protein [Saccharopolyspora dendranthemae]TWF94289.1 hypothetical protein FHU35_14576 [Saccharopolyspora dendranthemae]